MIFGMIHGGAVRHIARDASETSVCGRYVLTLGESTAPLCKSCVRITGHVEREVPTNDVQSLISGCTSDHRHINPDIFTTRKHSATELAMYRDVLDDYSKGAENDACWIGTLMLVLDRPKLIADGAKAVEIKRKTGNSGATGTVPAKNAKPARKRGCGASEKQEELIRRVIGEIREFNSDAADALDTVYTDEWFETVKWAAISPAITALFNVKTVEQRKARENAPKEIKPVADKLSDGVYVLNGQYIKVKHNQMGTRQYGVVFNPESGEWDYTPGITTKLTAEHKLTEDAAKAFGDLYGRCCECSRLLTDEESIRRGIGPVCAGNYGW